MSKEKIDVEKVVKQLSAKYNVEVLPIVFKVTEYNEVLGEEVEIDEDVIGYIKMPDLGLKMRTLDMAKNAVTTSSNLLEAVLLKDESDARIINDDKYYFGAAMAAFAKIEIAVEIKNFTNDEIKEKVNRLSEKYNTKVESIVFKENAEADPVIGFIKTPNRPLKIRILDMSVNGAISAATSLFDVVFIREESDSRFSQDKYYLGGSMAAFTRIEMAVNVFQKS